MKSKVRLLLSASTLLLFTVSCDDIQTGVAYDRSCDFTDFMSYSWVGRKDAEISALDNQKIISSIRSELSAKGLRSVDLEPDLYVTYFADKDEQVRVNIRHRGYSYGSDWYGAGGLPLVLGGSTAEMRTFEEGSLVVDIYKASQNQLVWRGVATGTISEDRKKNEKKIKKAIKKLFESYPPPKKG